MKAINYSRLNLRIDFGNMDATGIVNPNTGEKKQGFNKLATVWGGEWSINIDQNLTLQGLNIKNARVFFVRHNQDLVNCTHLQVNNDLFIIDSSSIDDGSQFNGFDLITCHKDVVNHV
ncbi:phage head closure protein [Pediococcus claussenii]|uniref:phage head closure protein n=1 Tax=Pediococcus claussenii TaxID=187452 RepID=UPI00081A586D|nr:phage head closure protein [Pediococcus claussenii]ANZ70371.1 hypothetical protein AYR57_08605 [Pediococcus claussenii]ANZ72187.1 hypothetical protein AYR58_08605 [Pediococcus claussenii]